MDRMELDFGGLKSRVGTSLVAQWIKNPPASAGDTEMPVQSLGRKDPWNWKWLSTQYSCLENSMDREAHCFWVYLCFNFLSCKER